MGDTEPRHGKFPECLVQLQDFAKQPFLPLFYMQLPRQCPQFIKWQKGSSPKEHQEIIDRQLHQQSTAMAKIRDFDIIWLSEKFILRESKLVLEATIRVDTFRVITIQSIALIVCEQEVSWNEEDTSMFAESVTDTYQFEFPLSIPRGKQTVKIKVIVEGREYILPTQLIINFPRKSN